MFSHTCQCLHVVLPASHQLQAQAPSSARVFWYIMFDARICIIADEFNLYKTNIGTRFKKRQLGKFGQGLTHVTTVIVHKGGVGGEP